VLALAALPSFTREEELDADTLAARLLARAGHDGAALPRMLAKIAAEAKFQARLRGEAAETVDPFGWLAVHPLWDGRLARAKETAERDDGGAREPSRDAYLDVLDGIPLGGDPKRGAVEGRIYVDPAARIRFEVPPGFHLLALPHGATAWGPRGARLIFDIARDTPNAGAAQHLAKSWAEGAATSPIEAIEVDGLEAATAAIRGRTDAGEADVRLVAIRGDGGTFYRFAFATPPERTAALSSALRRATYSFRRLSEAEAGAIRPLTLRVLTVGPGDTVESLAERMPFADHKLERIAVLNGLGPGGRLAPGLRVKIVSP
jgi:predicted Zn-dependent protease